MNNKLWVALLLVASSACNAEFDLQQQQRDLAVHSYQNQMILEQQKQNRLIQQQMSEQRHREWQQQQGQGFDPGVLIGQPVCIDHGLRCY